MKIFDNSLFTKVFFIAGIWLSVTSAGLSAATPSVPVSVLDSNGYGATFWDVTGASTRDVFVATETLGAWDTAVQISTAGKYSFGPLAAITSTGDIVAVWSVLDSTTHNQLLYYATLPHGGSWSTPTLVSDAATTVQSGYSVEINDTGQILITWRWFSTSTYQTHISAATGLFGGALTSVQLN